MVLLVLALLSVWDVKMASAAPSPAECKEEQRLGINACLPVSFGQQPSAACCERVRVSNGECICPAISPRLAVSAMIDSYDLFEAVGGRSLLEASKELISPSSSLFSLALLSQARAQALGHTHICTLTDLHFCFTQGKKKENYSVLIRGKSIPEKWEEARCDRRLECKFQ
ncbi:hypothetical protein RJ640_001035 [Escallonia rubra]|uniref:Bifunctional inhibitor/plant lipid transfer protein/seed storage helical domain-containing protein n=1 Tax=Escallonia rubra TaxID=112253 RepID=A0AA88S136_9ASTE|nr:hypothetical protein RJ640_001035 [Escallonia rubra]